MTTVYKYRIPCTTEDTFVYTWAESEPTVCPNDSGHTINAGEISIVETVAENHVHLDEVSKTTDNFLQTVQQPREGDAINFYSPNFCDETTWYEGATGVTEFSLTDSGDLTTWNTGGTHPGPWVDLYHGKIFKEDDLLATYTDCVVLVEVSTDSGSTWTPKTQNTFDDTDGDYSVDYDNGTVTFNSALNSGDQVRASFAKSPSSLTWTVKPATGKRLKLMYCEIQLTKDAEFSCDFIYETWAYNPADLPNKIKINEFRYKTMSDLLYESNGVYPTVPAIGGTGPRGLNNKEVVIFPFNYRTCRDMKDSQGVEVRVKSSEAHVGTMATTTFYCLCEDE
jgi:hypothetical protein